ncbi:MAG: hypothetical protein HY852_15930 [Bradyrhizobium sp.]|nr:hypothetical protein [Bradyrhizobium sp.]
MTDNGTPALSDARTFTVQAKRGSPWKYVAFNGTASSSTVYIYLTTPGEVYLDDLKLVAGSVPEAGANTVAGGDFETALTSNWGVSPNHQGSEVIPSVKHSGQSGLHVVASVGGTTRASSIYQDLNPGLVSGNPYTLSFWYLPGPKDTSLTIVPPGASHATVKKSGTAVRVFSNKAADLVAMAVNAGTYADGAPEVTPIMPWPDPVGGFRLRYYAMSNFPSLDPSPLKMRIFRSTNLMINIFKPWTERRDETKLSPHSH